MKKIYFLILVFVIFFANAQTEGVLVLNEGGAGSNNAEISLISNQSVVTNNYFKINNNNATLGDTAQDIKIFGDKIFVVLNISNQIKVINKSDFSLITTISSNLDNPRYIAFSGNKFYVTNWGGSGSVNNYVAVFDLNTYAHETNISVGSGPEKIYSKDNRLYVLLKGGFGINQFMDIINISTNTVESQVNVGDFPHSIFEKDNFLYIMSSGNPYTSNSFGTFTIYNTTTQNTVSSTTFPAGTKPAYMDTDGTNIYYMKDASIYKTPIAAPSFSTTPIATAPITVTSYGTAYGFNVVNNTIYVADPQGYIAPGKIYTYDLQGTQQNTFTVSMLPNQVIAYSNASLSTVESPKASKLSLYPNPTSNKFFVQGLNNGNIQVYDVNGKMIIHAQYTQNGIDVSMLSKGVYIVKITDKNNSFTEKLIIK
ncbi:MULTISPECIES: T9SS type A sorting domain-containing protein [unclassified Chryseobacterium]|uniref:T9SS type A sorting domain-containing protein n=1 Tax=unclassified Chryseobacterium TaxID=2593645 RepID=UPI000F45BCDE|nr:T9SS type A sorting domain-containing protein [Chryseobacterium sp. G0240]ROI03843.1 T9SS C-terminal target domain-containing protein [Chryseobacterium sp. G0240]